MLVDVCDRIGIRLRVSDMSGHLPPTEKNAVHCIRREKQNPGKKRIGGAYEGRWVSVNQVAS